MYYKILSNWEYSSLERDIERNLSSISDAMRDFDSMKREVDSQMRDYKYAQSSYERAWEDKVKEDVKKASTKSGYSSYGYSSYDGKIRDSQRIMERCLSKVVGCVSKILYARSKIDSLQRDLANKINNLMSAYKGLEAKASGEEKELRATSQKYEMLTYEKKKVEREARNREQELQSALDKANQSALFAGVTAAAAVVEASTLENDSRTVVHQQEVERQDWERKTTEMKSYYENEIANLKDMLFEDNQATIEGSKMLDELAANLADALKPSEGVSLTENVPGTAKEEGQYSEMLPKEKPTLIVEYAALWDRIMEDAIIELDEVMQIKQWICEHVANMPEGEGLMDWCEVIVSRGEVIPEDAQTLYDRSFMLLKALGAKIG